MFFSKSFFFEHPNEIRQIEIQGILKLYQVVLPLIVILHSYFETIMDTS